jgi:hypothetical protein
MTNDQIPMTNGGGSLGDSGNELLRGSERRAIVALGRLPDGWKKQGRHALIWLPTPDGE